MISSEHRCGMSKVKAQQLGSKSLNSSICSNREQLCKSLHPYVFRVSPAPAVADLSFTRFTRSVVQYTTYINLHYCCLRCCFNVQTLKNTGPIESAFSWLECSLTVGFTSAIQDEPHLHLQGDLALAAPRLCCAAARARVSCNCAVVNALMAGAAISRPNRQKLAQTVGVKN